MPGFSIAVNLFAPCPRCERSLQFGAVRTEMTCPRCRAAIALAPDRWREMFEDAVLDAPQMKPGAGDRRHGQGWLLLFGRQPHECGDCKQPIPDAVIEAGLAAGACACPGCRTPLGIRPLPPELAMAMPGITHLVGEEAGFGDPPASAGGSTQGRVVTCAQCAAALPVDGASRTVRCTYCNAEVVLPADLWRELHPRSDGEPHIFHLWHDQASVPRALVRSTYRWSGLSAAVADRDGNLYLAGESSGGQRDGTITVFSLDPARTTRWVRTDLEISGEVRLALVGDALLVWSPKRASALRLSVSDGSDREKLGGRQPDGADRHHFDLRDCDALAADPDGTLLAIKHRRLVRFDGDGTGIETWPPHRGFLGRQVREKLRPFEESGPESGPSVEDLHDHPLEIYSASLAVGWDGHAYLQGLDRLVRLARSGAKVYSAEIPRGNDWGVTADQAGNAYTLRHAGADTMSIHRIGSGGEVALHVDGRRDETPVREDHHLLAMPDGTLVVLDHGQRMRVFRPDGTLAFRSAAAEKADEEYARERARRVARDEDVD